MLDSQWWAKQRASQEEFRHSSAVSLQQEFADVDRLLRDLTLSRDHHVKVILDEGSSAIEKKQHEKELRRIQEQKEEEERHFKIDQEKRKRLAEIKRAQDQAEAERKVRAAEAAAAAERERIETERSKKEAEHAAKLRSDKLKAEKERLNKIEVDRAKAEKEEAERNEADRSVQTSGTQQQQQQQPQIQQQVPAKQRSSAQKKSGFAPDHIQAEFKANQDRIDWIKVNVKQQMAAQPKEVRNQTMDIKSESRPKFGMLTNTRAQSFACRTAVKELFLKVQQSGNPLMFQWTSNSYAKMSVEQSESEANVQLQNASPLAMSTILLWDEFPELGDFVIPRLIKRCPQIIGFYCPIDTMEGRKRMGWKKEGESTFETEEQYMGRSAGICAVWACMTQTKSNTETQKPHPYNIGHSWTFVSRLSNKPADLVRSSDYALAAAWWDMTALRSYEAFRKQAYKLLTSLWDDYTRNRMDPPAMRLRGLGENWQTTGKLEHAWKVLT